MGAAASSPGPEHAYEGDGKLAAHQVPVVYDPAYNVSFGGLEKVHPFDSCKYEKIMKALIEAGMVKPDAWVCPGGQVTPQMLATVHSAEYLESLKSSWTVAAICELTPAGILPDSTVDHRILRPMRTAVQGTIVAGELAARYGWAINLGGGMHHASSSDGGGWCIYSDIVLSFQNVVRATASSKHPVKCGMVIDCDVHQGNGIAKDIAQFHSDGSLFLVDFFGHHLWPHDTVDGEVGDLAFDVPIGMKDEAYLQQLKSGLQAAFKSFYKKNGSHPDIIYYNAGTDILDGDPLNGGVEVSRDGVAKRDALVFANAFSRQIPIVMVLSGGYAKDSAQSVHESIVGLFNGANQLMKQLKREDARPEPEPEA